MKNLGNYLVIGVIILISFVGLGSYYIRNRKQTSFQSATTKVEIEQEIKITLIGTVIQLNNTDPARYYYELTLNSPFYDELQSTGYQYVSKMPILSRDKVLQNSIKGYVGKEVAMEGLMAWGQGESRYLEVNTITDVSSWKTYSNKTYNYSIKFPATYQIPDQTEKVKGQKGIDNNIIVERKSDPSGSSLIVIDVNLDKDGISLEDYMNKNLKMFGIDGPLVSYKFNGYDSIFNKNQPGMNVFVKQGQYVYHITAPTASQDKEIGAILATFRFTNDNTSLNYVNAISLLQNVPEIQLLQNDIKRLGRTTFFKAGGENGDVIKIWLYEDGFSDNHTTRIDTFNVNIKTKVITVDDVAMMSGKKFISLEEWKNTVKERFR